MDESPDKKKLGLTRRQVVLGGTALALTMDAEEIRQRRESREQQRLLAAETLLNSPNVVQPAIPPLYNAAVMAEFSKN